MKKGGTKNKQTVKMVDQSTQTVEQRAVADSKTTEVRQPKKGDDLLRELAHQTSMMDFYERRGRSWPSKESLPWKVKMNDIYPDLSEFQ